MRDAEDRSLIGEIVIILILVDRRQQQQSDERGCQPGKECKHAAGIFGAFKHHSIRLTKTSAIVPQRAVGSDARMRSEKSGASSAASATLLIKERCRSSSNGKVVATRPEWER